MVGDNVETIIRNSFVNFLLQWIVFIVLITVLLIYFLPFLFNMDPDLIKNEIKRKNHLNEDEIDDEIIKYYIYNNLMINGIIYSFLCMLSSLLNTFFVTDFSIFTATVLIDSYYELKNKK
jgi:hypothetical protein